MSGVAVPERPASYWLRRFVVVTFVVLSVTAIVRGYFGPPPVFAWRMFPEASVWQAEIYRVDDAGDRIDVRDSWPGGYTWPTLVQGKGLGNPFDESGAVYGVDSTLHLLQGSLDWVAANTPDDHETVRLEAVVTYRHNGRQPVVVVLHSEERS